MRRLTGLIALLVLTASAAAHPATAAGALITVTREGRVSIALRFDTLAFALNDSPFRIADSQMNALLDAPETEISRALEGARERFLALFSLQADGVQAPITITRFPTAAEILAWRASGRTPRLPVRLELSAETTLPPSVAGITVRFPSVLGDVIVTIETPGAEAAVFPLRDGDPSDSISMRLGAPQGETQNPASDLALPGRFRTSLRYAAMGFTHILPFGADHILFVLGLFLLSPRLRPLLAQVTAFTVAHSITLALSLFGVVRLSPLMVEPLIAASIALVAVENLLTSRLHPWRIGVVFIFGLVHGMGFADALKELGVPREHAVTALVGFNLGVEAGQLAVLAIAFLAVGACRDRAWFRKRVTVPGSIVIAIIGAAWTIQRLA